MILSELNANTTLATRIKSFSLDQLLWVCQKGCHTIATERAEWWRRSNFGAIIYLAKYDKEETYSEIEKGLLKCIPSLGVEMCFVFPALGWGSIAGEFRGLIMYWPPKAPGPLPQYNDVTWEMQGYGNLQSGF